MKTIIILLPLLVIMFLVSCGQQSYKETRLLLDTICEITVIDSDSSKAKKAIDEAFKEITRIDKIFGYGKDSEVSKINASAGIKPIKVDGELFNLIKESVRISDLTEGAFDITVGPLITLWGFDQHKPSLPTKSKIKKILPLVNYRNIRIDRDKSTIYLVKSGMRIDLGGIAKKYAMRMTTKKLRENGIKKAMVNLGGDIQVFGGALNNQPWKIGLQHPRKPGQLATVFKFNDKTIVTSGDYERCFFVNGARYHHIFDPHTGYPTKGIISTTILTDGPIFADAVATAIFVLGVKKGMDIVEKIPNTDAIVISETKKGTKINISSGLKKANLDFDY